MMGNVCFGDDFWSDAREMGVPHTIVNKVNFDVVKYKSNSVNGIKYLGMILLVMWLQLHLQPSNLGSTLMNQMCTN